MLVPLVVERPLAVERPMVVERPMAVERPMVVAARSVSEISLVQLLMDWVTGYHPLLDSRSAQITASCLDTSSLHPVTERHLVYIVSFL